MRRLILSRLFTSESWEETFTIIVNAYTHFSDNTKSLRFSVIRRLILNSLHLRMGDLLITEGITFTSRFS